MSEAALQRRIQRKLNALPECWCLIYHGSPFARRGHSDLYGALRGHAFFFEVKRVGQKPTALQERFLETMREVGAIVGVVFHEEDAFRLLREAGVLR